MAKTIAFVNQKGGVGKTTSCVSLGSCLQAAGARVLVCDFDPQGNATSGFGVDKGAVFPTIYDVLINGASVEKAIVHTKYADVLPANKALAGASVELIGMDRRNLENMRRISGGDPAGKIHLLMEFAGKDCEVADPWYTGDFEATWQDVLEGCRGLMEYCTNRK